MQKIFYITSHIIFVEPYSIIFAWWIWAPNSLSPFQKNRFLYEQYDPNMIWWQYCWFGLFKTWTNSFFFIFLPFRNKSPIQSRFLCEQDDPMKYEEILKLKLIYFVLYLREDKFWKKHLAERPIVNQWRIEPRNLVTLKKGVETLICACLIHIPQSRFAFPYRLVGSQKGHSSVFPQFLHKTDRDYPLESFLE